MRRREFTTFSLVIVGFLTGACSQTGTPPTSEAPVGETTSPAPIELTISAAASVQDAMREVQTVYETANPEVRITYNFGSSGSLAQQITQGAPTDVFLSASTQWMDDLEAKGEILEDSRQDLLLNSLVLIVPLAKTDVTDFSDFTTDKVARIAIGEPESVPAGQYAKEALTSLNLFEAIQAKMVFAKDVRQVLAYVETGNVDAGLVYATDAKGSDQVQVVTTAAPESDSPIIYPVGVVATSENAEAAQAFVDFLADGEAIAIFENYGFTMAE